MSQRDYEKIATILKQVKFDHMLGLDGEQLSVLEQRAKALSFTEKIRLIDARVCWPGYFLYDAAGVIDAHILLDYYTLEDRKHKPVVLIKFTDYHTARCEVIDIIGSVKKDAALIGHPAILFAVDYWQEVLRGARYEGYDTIYDKAEEVQELKSQLVYSFVDSARHNLTAIGKALLEGSREHSLKKEEALILRIQELDSDAKNTYLRIAWERLNDKYVNQIHELSERIKKIIDYLRRLPTLNDLHNLDDFPSKYRKHGPIANKITITNVEDFLNDHGSRFVYDEDKVTSQRPQWKIFQNAFLAWYFDKKPSTLQKYVDRVMRKNNPSRPRHDTLFGPLPRTMLFQLMSDIYTREPVYLCPPFECLEDEVEDRYNEEIEKARGGQ